MANVEVWGNAQREKAMYQPLFSLLLLEPLDYSLVFSCFFINMYLKIHVCLPAIIYRLIRWAEHEHCVESKTKSHHFNFATRYLPFFPDSAHFSLWNTAWIWLLQDPRHFFNETGKSVFNLTLRRALCCKQILIRNKGSHTHTTLEGSSLVFIQKMLSCYIQP